MSVVRGLLFFTRDLLWRITSLGEEFVMLVF